MYVLDLNSYTLSTKLINHSVFRLQQILLTNLIMHNSLWWYFLQFYKIITQTLLIATEFAHFPKTYFLPMTKEKFARNCDVCSYLYFTARFILKPTYVCISQLHKLSQLILYYIIYLINLIMYSINFYLIFWYCC